MKRKLLLFTTILVVAAFSAACSKKEEAVAPGSQQTEQPADTAEPSDNELTDETPIVTGEPVDEEHNTDVSADQTKEFAEKVQKAVAAKDLAALSELCDYPVYVNGEEVTDKAAFQTLDAQAFFSTNFLESIAAADTSALEVFGAGIALGNEVSVFFNDINGTLLISSITTE